MKQSGILSIRALLRGMRIVCGLCLICALPSCNQARDTPTPKTVPKAAAKAGAYLSDMGDLDEPQLRSAVFSYTTHKGKVDDDSDKPLTMTVLRVTT